MIELMEAVTTTSRVEDESRISDSEFRFPFTPRPSTLFPTVPLDATPDLTRSSESSREATEADRQEARQLLSQDGAMRKTGWLLLRTTGPNLTNVLHNAGATGLTVRQLYNFQLHHEWRVHSFILLYKWSPYRGKNTRWNPRNVPIAYHPKAEDDSSNLGSENILLCGHTMDNASATHALIMATLNIPESGGGERYVLGPEQAEYVSDPFDIGDELRTLKNFLRPFDPVIRAAAVCSSKVVRSAHNKTARKQFGGHPELLDEDGKVRSTLLAEELWMYSVYVPGKDNQYIYEVEGMADEAHVIATFNPHKGDSSEWAAAMRRPLMERIATFREHQTPFLLFAVTSDIKEPGLPRVPRKGRNSERGNSGGMYDREEIDGGRQVQNDDMDADDDESEEEFDQELAREEYRRIQATHNYETFFVEMMKLMASRGDINAIVRHDDETSSQATSEEDEEEEEEE